MLSLKDINNEKVAVPGDQQLVVMAADQLAEIYNELDNGLVDTAAAAIKVTEQPMSPPAAQLMSSPKVQPSWSLPLVSVDDKQPADDYNLTDSTNQGSVSLTVANLDDDYLTNLTSQSSGHVTEANLYDSGFSSVSDTGHSLLLPGDASSSSTSSSSSSSPMNSIVTKMEQLCVSSMTSQGMTSATNLTTTIVSSLYAACSVLSQTSAPTVSNATLGSEPIAPVALQTSSPLSISSQSNSSISNPPNEMVDNLSLSSDCIRETDQQQNVLSEEDYSVSSSSSVYGSQTDISNHGSEASLRQAGTVAAAFPSLANLPLPIPGHGSETENYDASESVGLIEELQKVSASDYSVLKIIWWYFDHIKHLFSTFTYVSVSIEN